MNQETTTRQNSQSLQSVSEEDIDELMLASANNSNRKTTENYCKNELEAKTSPTTNIWQTSCDDETTLLQSQVEAANRSWRLNVSVWALIWFTSSQLGLCPAAQIPANRLTTKIVHTQHQQDIFTPVPGLFHDSTATFHDYPWPPKLHRVNEI